MNDSEHLLNNHDALSNQYRSTSTPAHNEEGYLSYVRHNRLEEDEDKPSVSIFRIIAILSGAFAYGGVMSTYFLLTLPIECSIFGEKSSIFLGLFVGLAGLSQLVSPVIGMLSDRCTHPLGRRRPYVIFGGVLGVVSLLVQQALSSDIDGTLEGWYTYVIAFFLTMCSMNIIFASMIALIPDLIPVSTLCANMDAARVHVSLGVHYFMCNEMVSFIFFIINTQLIFRLVTILKCTSALIETPNRHCERSGSPHVRLRIPLCFCIV